ncbi:hypothetical protein JIX56_28530 [Streptomyces sp. CA-210063]|uniref:hypothetical protein n=1 Tax=Streptomyces sp. CA-210063 TaxID=2801029 RepID=UPI00214CBAD0|nr:hypothetical protein [Streptomyces sp. CA-210063]UUU33480.1 hypothetical protein JIX56_28530 [Streptomyces sp. CA-210063]
MITTTPVARWTWGRDDEAADGLVLCLRDVLGAYAVLASHRLALGAPKVRLKVPESGNPKNRLFEGELLPGEGHDPDEAATRLADEARAALRPGEIGSVEAEITCTGVLLDGEGRESRQERLFLLGTAAYRDYVTTDLVTFSDAWMPYDLEGRPQADVHGANAPRLEAALRDLAEALGEETDPDDPTFFGRPTETGVDNFFEPDGSPSDVWSRFEIPRRSEVFRHGPVFDSVGYKRSGAEQVQCVPVVADHGGVLGYLWASDADAAASFEPRAAADEEGRKAGLVWLDRLHESYERGLTPVQALAACAALPADPVAGHVSGNAEPQIIALDDLREAAMHGD